LRPLQLALNMAANPTFRYRRECYGSPLLQNLCWLPIKKRRERKILALAYKAQNSLALSYLSELLNDFVSVCALRSSDTTLLAVPLFEDEGRGDHFFSSAGRRTWNSHPSFLRAGALSCFHATPGTVSALLHHNLLTSHFGGKADPGTSSVLVHSYFKAVYYSGLSSASPVLHAVSLVWNIGMWDPMHTESPSGYVYGIEKFQA